jgi:hypothetical protein
MSFINFSNIKTYIEGKINTIGTLSDVEAAQVAVNAFQLARVGNPPSNLAALETFLSGKESAVDAGDELKYITLLLGSSTPTKSVVWRMQEFLADGSFTVPNNIAGGVVYVTGCGGGASGQAVINRPAATTAAVGGFSGCFVERYQYSVQPLESIAITIGAGGLAQSVTGDGTTVAPSAVAAGGNTAFGALVIAGGEQRRGTYPSVASSAPGASSFRFLGGLGRQQAGFSNSIAGGSAAGYFGPAPNGETFKDVSGSAPNAAPNTGAVGASVCIQNGLGTPLTATSGAGGSGRIIVEWQEFL